MNVVLLKDLLSSKKFRVLLALVVLWSRPVREELGLSEGHAMPWLTIAFTAYFISQGFRDFGEEIHKAACVITPKGKAESEEVAKEISK